MWKGWKKDECRNRFFSIYPKEGDILVDHRKVGFTEAVTSIGLILELEKKRKKYLK
jgi:hypothetical protein